MKPLKIYILLGITALLSFSCSDFLDTAPFDALSPSTTWKTENDAQKFAIGCYNGWERGNTLLYLDCASDFAYNNFPWEGYTDIGNGNMSSASTGANFYNFTIIRRCNSFLENVKDVPFANEAVKKDLIAQIRVLRAYKYFIMNWMYGGVPIIDNFETAEDAKVPRNTEAEVRKFIEAELDASIPDLNEMPVERGRIAKGAALALRMREALYYEDWATAKAKAGEIIAMNQYNLEPDYSTLFNIEGQGSSETILAVQYIPQTYTLGVIGQMFNNADGGWSSIVPTYNLVDSYEMENGKTIDEAGSGYDAEHPFKDRDPRLAKSITYPGADYINANGDKAVFNTLDIKLPDGSSNQNYMTSASNSSKTGLTWAKYLAPRTQYDDIWATNACPIVFRYAEVLLSWAEAANEVSGPSAEVYARINLVRNRAGMPDVDQSKYSTKDKLRELIHRERGVEFAGEGLRRADILRWKEDGKMLAEKVMNGNLERRVGTVNMDASVDPEERATIKLNAEPSELLIEQRSFKPYNRYLPIGIEILDKNPKLEQNDGYL